MANPNTITTTMAGPIATSSDHFFSFIFMSDITDNHDLFTQIAKRDHVEFRPMGTKVAEYRIDHEGAENSVFEYYQVNPLWSQCGSGSSRAGGDVSSAANEHCPNLHFFPLASCSTFPHLSRPTLTHHGSWSITRDYSPLPSFSSKEHRLLRKPTTSGKSVWCLNAFLKTDRIHTTLWATAPCIHTIITRNSFA